ncbi:MAG TPA: LysR family transcriptional regulator [Anaeromyxobacteraceae bacterium]|nr:LysR family transcriptional regulator [Anaeromyxobacteraceae bacterium]
MRPPDWNDLRFVLALVRGGSLERAAEALDVDASTVSRRVHALERALDARVFDRTTGGHQLTEMGRGLAATAERVEAEIAGMVRRVWQADRRLVGTIRIATSDAVGRYLLVPTLAQFQRVHSQVRIQVVADVRPVDLIRREADVALRFARPRQALLVSRRVASIGHGLYGSAEYLGRRPFHDVADLSNHALLGYDKGLGTLPEARWLDERAPAGSFALRANRVTLLVEAVAQGMGLAVLPCYAAAYDGRLVELIGPADVLERDLWLVLHRDSRRNARTRALADMLAAQLPRLARGSPDPRGTAPAGRFSPSLR